MDPWIKFDKLPSKSQLESDFKLFLSKNEEFKGMIKIGKTSLQRMDIRYTGTSKNRALGEANIFAECDSELIALKIERMAQDYAKRIGVMIPGSDMGEGGISNDDSLQYIVYVTTFKPELFKCPLETCWKVMTKKGIKQHLSSHSLVRSTIRGNKLLDKMGIKEPFTTSFEPIPWTLEDSKSTTCPDCKKVFITKYYMLDHHRYYCPKIINRRDHIKCPHCDTFMGQVVLNRHIKTIHHLSGKIECDFCGVRLTKTGMEYHMDSHVGVRIEMCSICNEPVNVRLMNRHCKQKHSLVPLPPKPLKTCKICKKVVKHMSIHMKTHEDKQKCPHCSEFLTPQSLSSHIQEVHFKHEQGIIKCKHPGCDKEGTKSFMRSHAVSHKPRKICEWCRKEYSHDRMRKHIKLCPQDPSTSNSSAPVKKFKSCPYCAREYGTGDISKHIRLVHQKVELKDEDLIQCPECEKKGSAEYIKAHLRTHKRFKCPACNKEYSKKFIKNYKCEPSSSAEKKYKCNELNCPYMGATKRALRTHGLTHMPPVPCSYCGKLISREKERVKEVEIALGKFLEESKDFFKRRVKVGKTLWKSYDKRYGTSDKYEVLTSENIFAKCSNEKIALEVEKMCQEYLKKVDCMIENSDKSEGTLSDDQHQPCVVYITQLKANLFACPSKRCTFIAPKNQVINHIKIHQNLVDAHRANLLLKKLRSSHEIKSINPVSSNISQKLVKIIDLTMTKPKYYTGVPGIDALRKDFMEFIKDNPQFKGYVKVGKSSRQNLHTRYLMTDKYEQLDESNIFCYCTSEDIALEVEAMVQELTKENDTYIWRTDSGKGSSGGDSKDYLVYMNTLKPNLLKCSLTSCLTVMTKERIEQYKLCHDHIKHTIKLNDIMKKLSLPLIKESIDPIAWSIGDVQSKRCPDCEKVFATRPIMNSHSKNNCPDYFNRREKIQCSKCERYVGRKEMWKHNLHFHKHKNRVFCDLCGNKMTKENLGYRMSVHLGINKIPCEICNKLISFKAMKEHVDFKHKGKKRSDVLETCKICKKEVLNMYSHMKTHEDKQKCPHCSEFLTPQSLSSHIQEVHFKHEQGIIKCKHPGCDKQGTKSFMRSHAMSHKPRKTCEWCGKEYSHDRMRKHIKVCPQAPSTSNSSAPVKKLKSCPYCAREYLPGNLSTHIRRIHQKVELKDEDLIQCPECEKKGSAKYIKDHLRTHKRFKCPACNKEYSKKFIKNHKCEPSSSAEKKYKCNEPDCNYAGPTKGALSTHGLTHMPPVPCSYCAKLISRGNLSHVKWHRQHQLLQTNQDVMMMKIHHHNYQQLTLAEGIIV